MEGRPAGPRCPRIASWRGPTGGGGPSGWADGAEQLATRADEDDPAVVAPQAAPAHPGDLAEGAQLVEQPRLVARDPGGQDVALEDGGRDGAMPASWSTTSASRSSAAVPRKGDGVGAGRSDAVPGRAGNAPATPGRPARPRAGGAPVTAGEAGAGRPGRTIRVRRHQAGTRRGGASPPPGAALERVADRGPTGRPQRRGGLRRDERPVAASPPGRGAHRVPPAAGPRNAVGTPIGGADPDAVAVARDVLDGDPPTICSAIRVRTARRDATSSSSHWSADAPRRPRSGPRPRRPTRSPRRRSRSWTPVDGRRPAGRRSAPGRSARGRPARPGRAARGAPPARAARGAGRDRA